MNQTIGALRLLFSIDRELQEQESTVDPAPLRRRRAHVSRTIPQPVLTSYEALVRSRRYPPVVEASSHCGGCNLRLTLKLISEIRRGKRLLDCPHCGRLLFSETRQEPADPGAGPSAPFSS